MITRGTILIEKGTLCPQCFKVEEQSYPNAWRSVEHDLTPHDLENELATEGWTVFHMAGAIRTTASALIGPKMIHEALKRVITNVRLQKCNCLELTTWRRTRF